VRRAPNRIAHAAGSALAERKAAVLDGLAWEDGGASIQNHKFVG
jgi:hypothetical protein